MKILIAIIFYLCANISFAQQGDARKTRRTGNYEDQADSLRKRHLTPRRNDSIGQPPVDRMPVVKSDSNKNDPNMPVARPVPDQHMPVKELSDTSKQK